MRDGYERSYGLYALGSSASEGVSVSCPSVMPMPVVQPKAKTEKGLFPRVSEHLILPESTREEVVRGKLMAIDPGDPPHADEQAHVASLICTHSKPEYQSSVEMMTRLNEGSDFAVDASIRRKGIDPATGDRYLEELAFEVVNTQSRRSIEERAFDLSERGVRRIFAIFVKERWVGEWNAESGCFEKLDPKDKIKDQALVKPIKVKALLDMAEGEDEIYRALLVKNNRALVTRLKKERRKGEETGEVKGEVKGLEVGRKEGLEVGRKEGLEVGRKEGLEVGRKEGLEVGRKEGLEVGLEVGREEGLRLARIEDLKEVIEERFGSLPKALEAHIQTLPMEELKVLLKRAWKVERVEDLEIPHPPLIAASSA